MKIQEVTDVVYHKYHKAKVENSDPNYEPQIEVYMDYDYYVELHSEIIGEVPYVAYEFAHGDTIHGFKVWIVPSMTVKGSQRHHVPFRVVHVDT
jgi:hypothetical protein